MKLAKRNTTLIAMTLACALSIGGALTFSQLSKTNFLKKVAASTYTIALNSSTEISGLSSTASSGTFTTKTSGNSDVDWSFNNAKVNASGLMTLVRSELGNTNGAEAYLVNTSPITSISSIDLVFTGSYVTFYGSINGTDFERVKTVSGSGTFTELNNYFYVKICSGNQDMTDLDLVSLVINYDCVAADYTPEKRDSILNSGGKIDQDDNGKDIGVLSDVVFDSTRSTHSIKINDNINYSNIYNKYIYIKMRSPLSTDDASHSNLVCYLSTSDDATFASADDGTTAKDNFSVSIKLLNASWKEAASTLTTATFKKGQAYTQVVINMSSITWNTGITDVTLLRVSINRVITAGAVYLDDFHFEELVSYPSFSYSYSYPEMIEANDLSNGTYTSCYGGTTDAGSDTTFVAPARNGGSSTQSRKTTISSDWKMWNYAGIIGDLKNKSLTFDLLAADVTEGKNANMVMQFTYDGGTYKTPNLLGKVAASGISYETVTDANSNDWVRVTIDCYVFAASNSPVGSSNLGFNLGYCKTLYVDNLFVGNLVVA